MAFLQTSDAHAGVNGKDAFYKLKEKHQDEMRSRFDLWKRGEQRTAKYFHGFDQEGYRECFVFKRKQAGTYYRFYGFLFNPKQKTDPRYRVCILVQCVIKNTENTDLRELDFVNSLRTHPAVKAAIQKEFPEDREGDHAPLHSQKRPSIH